MGTAILIVYVAGVVIGLLRVDASPSTRVVVALLWPVGIAAGVITIGALTLAAMVLFPVVGAGVLVVGLGIWLMVAR